MGDFGQLALIILLAGGGNITTAVANKKNVTPVLFANAVLFIILAIIGSAWSFNVAKGLAGIYLLATFLASGSQLVGIITNLATGLATTGTKK